MIDFVLAQKFFNVSHNLIKFGRASPKENARVLKRFFSQEDTSGRTSGKTSGNFRKTSGMRNCIRFLRFPPISLGFLRLLQISTAFLKLLVIS